MTNLRCPVDGKLFFDYDETQVFSGTIVIKCRGRCGQCWSVRGIGGLPVVEEHRHPTTSPKQ